MRNREFFNAQWETLTISDNFVFSKTMELAPDLCRELLELILHLKIKSISWIEREKTLEERSDSKGIRLDVYVEEKGQRRSFNIEMQISNTRNLAKRMRYYQGMIDLDKLKRGQKYDELGASYIIFICLFDFFGKGRRVYTFCETCVEDSTLQLNDGTAKIFLNTKGTSGDVRGDLKAFLNYVEYGEVSGTFVEKLNTAVDKVKCNLETRVEYVNWQMAIEERVEERAKELAEERAKERVLEERQKALKERLATIKNFFALGTPIKLIAKATNLTEDEVSKILADDIPKNLEV